MLANPKTHPGPDPDAAQCAAFSPAKRTLGSDPEGQPPAFSPLGAFADIVDTANLAASACAAHPKNSECEYLFDEIFKNLRTCLATAGQVARCHPCHIARATRHRLFGLRTLVFILKKYKAIYDKSQENAGCSLMRGLGNCCSSMLATRIDLLFQVPKNVQHRAGKPDDMAITAAASSGTNVGKWQVHTRSNNSLLAILISSM